MLLGCSHMPGTTTLDPLPEATRRSTMTFCDVSFPGSGLYGQILHNKVVACPVQAIITLTFDGVPIGLCG